MYCVFVTLWLAYTFRLELTGSPSKLCHHIIVLCTTHVQFTWQTTKPLVLSISHRDNCNSAHFPDDCNPDYSIQTPPVDIDILSDEVSYKYAFLFVVDFTITLLSN